MGIIVCVDKDRLESVITDFYKEYVKIMYTPIFLSEREIDSRMERYKELYEELRGIENLDSIQGQVSISAEKIDFFMNKMKLLNAEIEWHNDQCIEIQMEMDKLYLDDILRSVDSNISLDKEQRMVVLNDSDAALVVAGAGAGKTTTMAAKVKYLVERQNVNPDEIIVISFTNKAVKELKDKIQNQLGIPAKVTTFHAFGNEIIRKSVEDYPEIETYKRKYFIDILKNRIYENRLLLKNVLLFFGYYMDVPEEALDYNNLAQYHEQKCAKDFETMKSVAQEYSRQVIDSLTKKTRTIKGEFMRSTQEVQIANYLYLHNLEYQYEKEYEFDILNAKKKYTPDFFIKQGGKELYLEHFGIHEDGTSTRFTQDELKKYKQSIENKIRHHKKYGTNLEYTFASYKDGRSLLEHLEAILIKNGFKLEEKDDREIYRQLIKVESDKYIYRFAIFMEIFISRFKTNGYEEKDFAMLKQKTDNVRNRLFLDIAKDVYCQYQAMLVQNRKIDFEDMINRAEKLLGSYSDNKELGYKYVIIDEYQDIARQRFNLTKKLAEICKAKVIAVGDDWQSIYAFSGSDISLFTNFLDLMGHGKLLKITKTYRNSQELIDIAGSFVQENESQIKKQLQSPKHIENPIVIKTYDDSQNIMKNKTKALIDVLRQIQLEFGEEAEVLLISRYGFEINQFCKTEEFLQVNNSSKVICKQFPKMKLSYMTAHSSKGLGFDNVVILNGAEGKFGFPSQIDDDPIMKLVTVEDRTLPFAEERRLFYVALTRTKNRTYILTPENKPSRFVMELIQHFDLPVAKKLHYQPYGGKSLRIQCPECGYPLKKEYNQNYGLTLFMCTNEPEVCDFMSNNGTYLGNIHKCKSCEKGYMVVKANNKTGQYFFGCTNYNTPGIECKNSEHLK